MASSAFKVAPIPSQNVDASQVAVASTVSQRRMNTALNQAAGIAKQNRTITASTFLSSSDGSVFVDTTAAPVTVTLPRVSEYTKMVITVQRKAGANVLTVARNANSSDTIDGAVSVAVVKSTTFTPQTSTDWHVEMVSA